VNSLFAVFAFYLLLLCFFLFFEPGKDPFPPSPRDGNLPRAHGKNAFPTELGVPSSPPNKEHTPASLKARFPPSFPPTDINVQREPGRNGLLARDLRRGWSPFAQFHDSSLSEGSGLFRNLRNVLPLLPPLLLSLVYFLFSCLAVLQGERRVFHQCKQCSVSPPGLLVGPSYTPWTLTCLPS